MTKEEIRRVFSEDMREKELLTPTEDIIKMIQEYWKRNDHARKN